MLALAFATGLFVAQRRAERRGLSGERVLESGMVILISSILGSRLLYVLTHWHHFRPPRGTWVDVFNPLATPGSVGITGLSMTGGVVLAAASAVVFIRRRGVPVLPYVDILAPSVALGEGITRIGCFLNGCCFGTPSDLPWAVRFPHGSAAATTFGETALHPAQIYSSIAGFALFGLLLCVSGRRRREGMVFFGFLLLWGTSRVLLDPLRYYEPGAILVDLPGFRLTVSQGLSLLLAAAGLCGILAARKDSPPSASLERRRPGVR